MTMTKEIRHALWLRAGGRCEITGAPLGSWDAGTWEVHHRRNKGMGGTTRPDRDALSNLLALTPLIHNGGPQSVHSQRSWSERHGYLIPKHMDWASLVPVYLMIRRTWVFLGDDGRYHSGPPVLPLPSNG